MRAFYFPKIILLIFVSTLMSFTFPKPVKKPNVIFFLVDDMGWMDIGVNGSTFYETPNIDRLASEGVRFTQAYAASPVCSPTRASILTILNSFFFYFIEHFSNRHIH
jgi:arylsulfatase A-like enzyme